MYSVYCKNRNWPCCTNTSGGDCKFKQGKSELGDSLVTATTTLLLEGIYCYVIVINILTRVNYKDLGRFGYCLKVFQITNNVFGSQHIGQHGSKPFYPSIEQLV